MVNRFDIEGRNEKRKKSSRLWISIPILFFLLSFLFHLFLTERLASLARLEGKNKISQILEASVYEALGETGVSYSSLIHLRFTEDGNVAALESDLVTCNLVCIKSLKALLKSLERINRIESAIPIGNLTGLTLLSGKGASCRVSFIFTGAGKAYLESRMSEAGINQTRHEIRLVLEVETLILLPGHEERSHAKREVPLAETVIVGRVPDAYTEIHRMSDDITESEIDDIYDFGAG